MENGLKMDRKWTVNGLKLDKIFYLDFGIATENTTAKATQVVKMTGKQIEK